MSTILSAHNSRLSITLAAPSSSFHPGETLHPTVTIHGSPSFSSLSLRLRGRTKATIMGKDRWQQGQMSNLGMGGSAMMITSIETHTFVELDVPLVGPGGARERAEMGEKHGKEEGGSAGGVYEVVLPAVGDGQLLPSYDAADAGDDAAGVSVTYTLELLGTRHGLFKSNDKLSIEIPVSIPLDSPIPTSLDPSQWPSNHFHPLLSEGPAPPTELPTLSPIHLSYHPLSSPSSLIRFRVSLTPPDQSWSSSSSSETPLAVTASLARRIRTTPVDDPESGKTFEWAGIRIAPGVVKQSGSLEWEGTLEVPKGQRTVMSASVGVSYVLTVKVVSPVTKAHILASMAVFIPSSERVASAAEGGDLPAYSA
ncbi:hypothetical protein RQP46_003876 [Phenoliferia psychrophenolica]